MYIEDIPRDVVYNHIFLYCHIEDLFLFSQTAKNSQKLVKDYFADKNVNKLIKQRFKERKKEKQLFFYHYILKIPDTYLLSSIDMARVFCYIDDQFHNTSFTINILKWKKCFKNCRHEEWTYNHSQFYKYCLDEIKHYYYNIY